jgi:L-rhamnose 1-dehydrogenase
MLSSIRKRRETKEHQLTDNQAIALDYIRHGAKVSISHLGGEKEASQLEALLQELTTIDPEASTRFTTVAGDISQPETGRTFIAKTVEAFGRLDIFVSNAGVCQFAEFLEYIPPLLILTSHSHPTHTILTTPASNHPS